MKLKKEFFARDAGIVARELLGKVLVSSINGKILRGKIVETEGYHDGKDPASRARQNGDLKKTMEMEAGTILVYGVHNNWLVNIVTGKKNEASAVLIRALEPINCEGKCNGPGLLTKFLGINKSLHKKSVLSNEEFWVEEGKKENFEIEKSFRIGVKNDLPQKLRFYIKGNKFVSRASPK